MACLNDSDSRDIWKNRGRPVAADGGEPHGFVREMPHGVRSRGGNASAGECVAWGLSSPADGSRWMFMLRSVRF